MLLNGVNDFSWRILNLLQPEEFTSLEEYLINTETEWCSVNGYKDFVQIPVFSRGRAGNFGGITSALEAVLDIGARLTERALSCKVSDDRLVTVSRMSAGSSIALHTDSPDDPSSRGEIARLLFYFGNRKVDGGGLVLGQLADNSDHVVSIKPIDNTAVLMRLSDKSAHEVAPVVSGVRRSATICYWSRK